MAIYRLKPNERKLISVSSRFLNVLSISGGVEVDAPSYDLKPVKVKSGWQLDLNGIPSVYITNLETVENECEMQDAGIGISLGGGGGVTVENKPTIRRIEEQIQVNANAIINGGTVSIIGGDVIRPLDVIEIQAGQRVKIADARQVAARKITLQVISEPTQAAPRSVLHIGHDATIDDTKGIVLVGSINAIAVAILDTSSAIYLYNASASAAKVTGMEQYSTQSTSVDDTEQAPEVGIMPNTNFNGDANNDGVPDNWSASDAEKVILSATNLGQGNTLIISN